MPISRAKKGGKEVKTAVDFINEAGEAEVLPEVKKMLLKKAYYFEPETVEKLELLKIKRSRDKKVFVQDLLEEACQLLFEKYGI